MVVMSTEHIQLELDDMLNYLKEESLQDMDRFDRLSDKLDVIELSIRNRNKIEEAHTVFDFSHLATFITIGTVFGSIIGLIVEGRKSVEKKDFNKV